MRFRVLGPVLMYDGDAPVVVGGSKPRLLLAALLCEPGRVVAVDVLIDSLWGGSPPPSCRSLVQTYVHGLRKALNRPDAGKLIVTRAPGYLIQAGPADIDSVVFERLVDEGWAAAKVGDHSAAVRAFREADALWHGEPFGGIDAPILADAALRLSELRLSATEQRMASEMALGHEHAVLAELRSLVAAHPTRERLRAHLMVALYRLGRQADALDVYQDAREILLNQLGIDPGPELQDLHRAILRSCPSLLQSTDAAPERHTALGIGRSPTPVVAPLTAPAQLPAIPPDFTGRDAQIAELIGHLGPDADRAIGASATCVITGPSGVGKSTLALRVAHELAAHFPDGQLYADLRGSTETPAQTADVLGRFLRALDADGALPDSLDERADRFRTVMRSRRVLVFLDDALDERHVRALLPSGPGNCTLVTARRRLSGLSGATHLDLAMLSEIEAVELLGRVAGEKRIIEDPEGAREIVALCGCQPLAVRIVGARLASRPYWTMSVMVSRLLDENRRLDEIAVADQQVVAGLELTYRSLHIHAREALCCLGWLGLPDFPSWIVAPLLGITIADAEAAIEQLIDAKAVDFTRIDALGLPRYRIHELLRVYAGQRAIEHDNRPALVASVRRLLLVWVRLIRELSGGTSAGTVALRPAQPLAPDVEISDLVRADLPAWLDGEQYSLVAAVDRAAALDLADACTELASALYSTGLAIGNILESFYLAHRSVLDAARRVGDRTAEAALLTQLGQLCSDRDRYSESRQHLLDAVTIFQQLEDRHGEAVARAGIGTAWWANGDARNALPFLEQAHTYFIATTAPDLALGFTARLIGLCHLDQGDFAKARTCLEEAVAVNRRLGSRAGEALSLKGLGTLHQALGNLNQAVHLGRTAMETLRSLNLDLHAAYAAESVAEGLVRLGRDDHALSLLDHALATCERFGDRWGQGAALCTRGELHLARGRLSLADADLGRARDIFSAIDAAAMRARTERAIAALRETQGDQSAANSLRRRALEISIAFGTSEDRDLESSAEPADVGPHVT